MNGLGSDKGSLGGSGIDGHDNPSIVDKSQRRGSLVELHILGIVNPISGFKMGATVERRIRDGREEEARGKGVIVVVCTGQVGGEVGVIVVVETLFLAVDKRNLHWEIRTVGREGEIFFGSVRVAVELGLGYVGLG